MTTFIKRMVGAAALDAATYEQVESDRASTGTAIVVVAAASISAAIGLGITEVPGIVGITLAGLLTWIVWVSLTFLVGKYVLPGSETRTGFGELLRTTGFSASPGLLRVVAGVSGLGMPVFLAITVWMLFTFVVAVRQALDYASFGRALAVCILGWTIHGILFFAFVAVAI